MPLIYNHIDLLDPKNPIINGKPLPPGVTLNDWMRITGAPGFYSWLNAIRGCVTGQYWRLSEKTGWCGV
jgi:hypothetical protein